MFKIKKKADKPKRMMLYNIVEDYSEFDAPGNVTVCAMTEPEDLLAHAKILSESYDVPLETMTTLLTIGGTYVYPQIGGILTRGLFACRIDPAGQEPKQTWTLDLMQFAEAEQVARSRTLPMVDAAWEVFCKTLPDELKTKLQTKEFGIGLPNVGSRRRQRRRHQVHRFPQGLVTAFQAALHHAGWAVGRDRGITGFCRTSRHHRGAGPSPDRARWYARSEWRGVSLSDRERSAGCGSV